MKVRHLLATAALGAALFAPSMGMAGAADTVELTVVDGFQYIGSQPQPHSVCLDEVAVKDGPQVLSTVTVEPGDHTLRVGGPGQSCDDEDAPWDHANVTITEAASQTLAFGNPQFDPEIDDFVLPTWHEENIFACTEDGQGRVVLRNYTSGGEHVVDFGKRAGDEQEPLIENVSTGESGEATTGVDEYPDTAAGEQAAGWVSDEWPVVATPFDSIPVAEDATTVIYAVGGNDGDIALVFDTVDNICDEPEVPEETTTTVAEKPETPSGGPAEPVSGTPTYTG